VKQKELPVGSNPAGSFCFMQGKRSSADYAEHTDFFKAGLAQAVLENLRNPRNLWMVFFLFHSSNSI
jgi:hypothetical protein